MQRFLNEVNLAQSQIKSTYLSNCTKEREEDKRESESRAA